jgi:hypothetical protein
LTSQPTAPLVVEWSGAARGQLETLRAKHLVAVHYSGCELEVLPACEVRGGYSYVPVTPKHERLVVHDEDELYANIPLHAAALEGKLKSAGQLNVKMTVVGRFESPDAAVSREALSGDCDRATHVITGLTTGAFSFFAGRDDEAGGGVTIGGLGGGASAKNSIEVLNKDGDESTCEKAAAADRAPPFGCGALIRLEIVPVGGVRTTQPACPDRTRWDGTQCVAGGGGSVTASLPPPVPESGLSPCPTGMHHEGEGCVPNGAQPGAMVRIPGAPMLYMGKQVDVATFEIDVTEVTLAAYKACVDARACTLPFFQDQGGSVLGRPGYADYANAKVCHWADGKIDHPINCVDFNQASAYCRWAGKRLPTAVEFLFSGIGETGWNYPWGNERPEARDPRLCRTYDATCPVWSNPGGQSKFGVFHLADNVGEWLADPYCPNADAPCKGDMHRVVGGQLASPFVFTGQSVGAAGNEQRGPQNGFRCARTP